MVKKKERNIRNMNKMVNIMNINIDKLKEKDNKKNKEKEIKIESDYYYIKPEKYETEKSYKMRIKYIENYNPKNIVELRESIVYSKVYRNIKLLGCMYEKELEKKVKLKMNMNK